MTVKENENRIDRLEEVLIAIVKTVQDTQQAIADTFDVPVGALFSESHLRRTNDAHSPSAEDVVLGTIEEGA